MTSSTTETAAAPAGSSFSIWVKTLTEATSVLNGMLPEMSTTEPNSPMARAKPRPLPVRMAGSRVGRMMRRRMVGGGAERRGRLLHVAVQLQQDRLHGTHHERQRDEQQGQQDARLGVGEVEAERALGAVQRQQRQAGDDRRQGERQVDQRVDERLPGNSSRTRSQAMSVPMTALMATTMSARNRVSWSGGQGLAVGHGRRRTPAGRWRPTPGHGRERDEDDQAEVGGGDARADQQAPGLRRPEELGRAGRGPARRTSRGRHGQAYEAQGWTPRPCSILATMPLVLSKNFLVTLVQPPRSSMVNRPAGRGEGDAGRRGDAGDDRPVALARRRPSGHPAW